MPQPKRRRLRRHPVWMFFKDLEDRMVGCINCNFRTGSAFSTNLKMHLKAHHKDDYERVLKLEGDMRVEENVTGPPNKIKNELIDFIRGGGNASTASAANPCAPRASPLIQQFISQTMAARQSGDSGVKKESLDEDPFNGMSMSDKLAALVGLVPTPGGVEGEIKQEEEPEETVPTVQNAFDEIRRAADNMLAANMGLAPPPQEQTIVNLNGSIVTSETQSTSSASTDESDEKKVDRDMALAKFWFSEGANNNLLQSELFKPYIVLWRTQTEDSAKIRPRHVSSPDLSLCRPLNLVNNFDSTILSCIKVMTVGPDTNAENLISMLTCLNQLMSNCWSADTESAGTSAGPPAGPSAALTATIPAVDVASLTYDGLFDTLTSLQKTFGADELTSFVVVIQLLKASVKSDEERVIVDTVAAGLERIYSLNFETDRSERTKKLISEKMKLKRLFETSEQREHRLQRMKERYRLQRDAMNGSKPDRRKKEYRNDSMSTADSDDLAAQVKEERLRRLRDYQRKRLLNEKPEQRARRLAKMRENQKLRRARQLASRNIVSAASMIKAQRCKIRPFLH
ncbi:hypothetical protein ANCCAN_16865 [Ancylostoma caninum]|uniref:BED-type domain-containing protein n=1 Tax=Ancylostoma caninum TaxID=29170 RepID=A0A368FYQ3_ANCCA|nr:hypothetical protein ANCCAN_16865 [Ancylostoma caninum]